MAILCGNRFGFAFFKRFATPLVLTLLALFGLKVSANASPLPAGFQETVLFSGFYLPTAVRFAPDGHVFIIEKYGKLFTFDNLTDTTATVVNDFEPQLWSHHDHGMLGLAVDLWPTRPYVYLMYAMRGSPGGRISGSRSTRLTSNGWQRSCPRRRLVPDLPQPQHWRSALRPRWPIASAGDSAATSSTGARTNCTTRTASPLAMHTATVG